MKIELARYLARTAFRNSRELSDLVPFLKKHLSNREYQTYSRAVATAVAAIQVELLNRLTAEYPALQVEIEASIANYERYL